MDALIVRSAEIQNLRRRALCIPAAPVAKKANFFAVCLMAIGKLWVDDSRSECTYTLRCSNVLFMYRSSCVFLI